MAAFSVKDSPTVASTLPAAPLAYKQLDILHSLRGFCAFYVVIFHAKFILWSGGRQFLKAHPQASWGILDYVAFAFDLFSSSGYEIVIFFFVLSGFLIRYAQHKKHRTAADFYLNRVKRIYPPFLVSLLLAAGVLALVATQVPQALASGGGGRELNVTLAQAWSDLQQLNVWGALRAILFMRVGQHYLGANVVYWSLLPEAIFYLIVPLAFWRIRWYYAASVLLFIVGLYCEWQAIPLGILAGYACQYNAYFAIGIALYDIVVSTNWLRWVGRIPRWPTLPILLGLLLLIGATLLKLKIIPTVLTGALAVVSVSVLLAGHVSTQSWLVRVLHKIGEFSFSLYLYHYPLLLLLYAGLVSYTGKLFVYSRVYWLALPLVTVACYGLYWVTERVSIKYFRG